MVLDSRCVLGFSLQEGGKWSVLPGLSADGWSESHKQAREPLVAFTSVNSLSDQQTTAGINYRTAQKREI